MRTTRLLVAALITLSLTVPVAAFYDIEDDRFDPGSGQGTAVIHVGDDVWAWVVYVDLDGDGKYSPGDDRIRTVFFRK